MQNTPLLPALLTLAAGLAFGYVIGTVTKGDSEVFAAELGPGPEEEGRRTDLVTPVHAGNGDSQPADADGQDEEEPNAAPRSGSRREAVAQLFADLPEDGPLAKHLEALLEQGLLEQHFAQNPEGWDWLIYEVYLGTGNPEMALELFQERPMDGDYGMRIAELLHEKGNPAAADALAETLRLESYRMDATELLSKIDSGRAVSVLREALATQTAPGDQSTRMRLAEALANAGSSGEALAYVNEMFDREEADETTWDLYRKLDPDGMELRIESMLSSDGDLTWHREQLASLLFEQGRKDEAKAHIDQLLADGTGTPEARKMLLSMNPERGTKYLEDAAANSNDPSLYNELASHRMTTGNKEGAVEAWMEAFRSYPGDNEWCRRLEEHAFDDFIDEYRQITVSRENDELWGDLGDAYDRKGLKQDALSCYDKAHELDPGDSEWTGKQARLRKELGV